MYRKQVKTYPENSQEIHKSFVQELVFTTLNKNKVSVKHVVNRILLEIIHVKEPKITRYENYNIDF